MKITSKELRKKWIKFYEEKGHVDIGSVSLIGDGKTGVMFNVAGMQSLMPYLLGEKHQKGTRLCNVQGCIRTVDIESVGDESHFTFFEMAGSWSLGDYFKKEKTTWTFEFLTKVLGFDKDKLCATVFAGNENFSRDDEIVQYLIDAGVNKENIYYLKDNWWDLPGTLNTPCGPDNEWFYPRHNNPCGPNCNATCECGRWVEVGNDVYMQYKKIKDDKFELLKNKNIDTGFGFERLLMYVNDLNDGYKTDIFIPVIRYLEYVTGKVYGEDEKITKAMRIIADHIRTSTMIIGDINGITPSNVGSGYILRRLLRRSIRYASSLGLSKNALIDISKIYIHEVYDECYPLLVEKEMFILDVISKEQQKFEKTLEQGIKEFNKLISSLEKFEPRNKTISGDKIFKLFDTFGFPFELTKEMAFEIGYSVDEEGFKQSFRQHQEVSRSIENGKNKGGIEEVNEITTKMHTATHLMLAGLRNVLGENVYQRGCNTTVERIRFDFSHDKPMTQEEIKKVEDFVNSAIRSSLDVVMKEMTVEEATESGAMGVFDHVYGDIVKTYKIGNISYEICGGPHIKNTSEIGNFKIVKKQSSSAGVRRIRAEIYN